nr:uncharacterized protein I203_00803 [Kwoniella mangroviensis CBS 8507]OCF70668.1 hypothetical protein I203_00803 [Kwoniella mangroviensis CBS 8507]
MTSQITTHNPGTNCIRRTVEVSITSADRSNLKDSNDEVLDIKSSARLHDGRQRVWKGIYGRTTDDNATNRPSIGIFVPEASHLCQITVDNPASTGTQSEEVSCTAGYIDMNPSAHTALFISAAEAQNSSLKKFDPSVDLSEASLGNSPQDYKTHNRMFRFEIGHAVTQPQDGQSTGFRSCKSFKEVGVFPHKRMREGAPCYTEVEMVIPLLKIITFRYPLSVVSSLQHGPLVASRF